MSIIVLQHTAAEGPGRLGTVLRSLGRTLDIRRLDLPVGTGLSPTRNQHIPTDFDNIDGVIALGGPMMVGDDLPWMQPELEFLAAAHRRKLPLVGICLGAQMIARALGGEVGPIDGGKAEWGMLPVRQHPVANTDIILAGVAWSTPQFHCHGQEVKKLPAGAMALQSSSLCKVQSFRVGLRTYAFQYHFEYTLDDIRIALTSNDPQMAQAGLDAREGLNQARAQYDEYARLGDRLCQNLATYLFAPSRSASRAMSA